MPYGNVLITGASAGIGAAYARELGSRGRQLTLVGRRIDRLEDLAEELRTAGAEVHVLAVDLSEVLGVTQVVECIRQRGPLDLLVNNAGFGVLGAFAEQSLDDQLQMVRVHIDATLALSRAALPGMREKGGGAIINVSSGAALSPFPGSAVYGGSKAFLNNFSVALQSEEKEHGVRIQCLCPGYTITEFHGRESFQGFDVDQVPEHLWMTPEQVVKESLQALQDGPVVVIPGAENRRLIFQRMERQLMAMAATDD